ncbi:unnamed protein product [Auanema sp. JU1783]|nr:unnamed protein product [Auanema sp. JU1783]
MNVNPYHGKHEPKVDDKLANLHKEMTSLRLECDRLINKHLIVESNLNQDIKNAGVQNPDTSSAYNTGGESCRSNSITPDSQKRLEYGTPDCQQSPIGPPPPPTTIINPRSPRLIHRSHNLSCSKDLPVYQEEPRVVDLKSSCEIAINRSGFDLTTPGYCEKPLPTPKPLRRGIQMTSTTSFRRMGSPTKSIQNRKEAHELARRFRVPAFSIVLREPSVTVNQPKSSKKLKVLSHVNNNEEEEAIPMPKSYRVQKTREKLYMFDRPIEEIPDLSDDGQQPTTSKEASCQQEKLKDEPVQFKWKVKRRCDGSRYVVKRPIRSQILKKREAQLLRERTGISTDDDAQSELMMGHFYRREERKRHLEKERLRKELQQQKLLENVVADQTIVQLSQQKMQKKKDNMLFDEFVTTQEVLSQRNTCTVGKPGILSVTTV